MCIHNKCAYNPVTYIHIFNLVSARVTFVVISTSYVPI